MQKMGKLASLPSGGLLQGECGPAANGQQLGGRRKQLEGFAATGSFPDSVAVGT
jgi:hypothetical protein